MQRNQCGQRVGVAGTRAIGCGSKTTRRIDAPHAAGRPCAIGCAEAKNRAEQPQTFEAFAAALRAELRPLGVLERVVFDQIVASAWRLDAPAGDAAAIEDAGRVLALNLRALSDLRSARSAIADELPGVDRVEDQASFFDFEPEPADEPRDLRALRDEADRDIEPEPLDDDEDSTDPSVLWRGRLGIDPNVSDTLPVVLGTWVTVAHVVSLVVDGWTWADILRAHPELTEADVRACLAYSVEEEGSCLAFD